MKNIVMYSSPCSVTFDPSKPIPKLCKDCVHFIPPKETHVLRMGKCKRLGDICLIDGEIDYKSVGYVRENYCKGEWFVKEADKNTYE